MSSNDLQKDLEAIIKKEGVPALAAAAFVNGELREIAAAGLREFDKPDRVTVNDIWHIGSCTKPMTATLTAILIEDGHFSWNTKIADIFEFWGNLIQPGWRKVTLEQLLAHRGGAPANVPPELWEEGWKRIGTPMEQRAQFVRQLLTMPPAAVPGKRVIYSNTGYAIIGHMLEHCLEQEFEDLMQARLFSALGMDSAGFGPPGTPGIIDQPRGHELTESGGWKPVEPGLLADNPPLIAPAATVHCSIEDLGKFAASHANRLSIVSEESLERLQSPYRAGEFGLGWVVVPRSWGSGNVLTHTGSNTFWYTSLWIAPKRHAAFVAATNAPRPPGETACSVACEKMIIRILG
jgi:CubicO group peptidase (beta-lactamase class C family)